MAQSTSTTYYQSYRLVSAYLAFLDQEGTPLPITH